MIDSPNIQYHKGLHIFAFFTLVSTFLLICLGGHVTSKEAGMAVPDWPTTYGENMFLYPVQKWVGGIFWEHSHRLVASWVGMLTIILTAWTFIKDKRFSMKLLTSFALILVVIQGLLGGLRVVLIFPEIGIIHGALAQIFFSLIAIITLMASRLWLKLNAKICEAKLTQNELSPLLKLTIPLTCFVFFQLLVGASMRHEHAGLAIPDFPLHYGQFIPPLSETSVEQINEQRELHTDLPPTSSAQIALHYAHRLFAYLLTGLFIYSIFWIKKHRATAFAAFKNVFYIWLSLVIVQIGLGIATVLSQKAAAIATLHVANGACLLALGVVINVLIWQCLRLINSQNQNEASKTKNEEAVLSGVLS